MFFGFSKKVVSLLVAVLVAAAGCRAPEPRPFGKPRVLATTTVVADLVRQVAGDRAEVECLMAPGIDPHSYRPTPADADRLARADLVVASGLQLEGRLAALLERLGTRRPVLAVGDRLPRERLLPVTDDLFDPHVWFDAGLWSLCPPLVAEALAGIDPAGAPEYHARAAAHAAALATLDGAVRGRIATIPQQRRVLVTAHDAFRYFGRAYGIEVVGVQGTSTESEAGLHDVNRLVDLLVSRGIPAVFVETSVADRNVAALIEGARSRGQAVVIGGRLYSDSLGEPGSGADTLAAALTANVETIVAALHDGGR
ncbi:MAG: zinc ABC transporter substrate-binding protein [Planctomycetaceae bacterium]|jgi:manganese/zinc/iron transport system substrate-binding protein|nr:zinc ABC transporter substrate-binding protein [Planctomycetaceae bacterium]